MADDSILLTRYAEGDEAAFSMFVSHHIDLVYSSALRRVGGDRHLAEDVAQQVFYVAARNAPRLARHAAVSGWLFTVTRNVAAQLVRTERRRKKREQEAFIMDSAEPSDTLDEWHSLQAVLEPALDRLGPADRSAVLMRCVEQRGFAEIGRRLNTSEDAARMRVCRAMERLRAILAKRGITSSAAALAAAIAANAASPAPAGLGTRVSQAAVVAVKLGKGAAIWSGAGSLGWVKPITWGGAAIIMTALVFSGWNEASRRQESADAGRMAAFREAFPPGAGPPIDGRRMEPKETAPAGAGLEETSRSDGLSLETASRDAENEIETRRISEEITYALHTDAELLRLRLELLRSEFPLRYAPLYLAARLSDAQIVELERLMAARAAGRIELMADKFRQGLDEQDAGFAELRAENERKIGRPAENAMRAMLGEAGFAQLEVLAAGNESPASLDSVAAKLAFTDAPLTAQQWIEVCRILAPAEFQRVISNADAWNAARSRLERILLPSQLSWTDRLRERERVRQEFARRKAEVRSQIVDAAIQGSDAPPR